MAKIIKLTEEDISKVIRQKVQESLEHNVDLEYSPAIGNKKRGPGKETMDQMKKRKNTKLDEETDEKDIYRRLPDGDYDYDGDDGVGTEYYGKTTYIELTDNAYSYAFEQIYGKVPGNLSDVLEENNLPIEVEIKYDIDYTEDPGDYDTPPYSNAELANWEIIDDLKEYGEFENVIRKATEYEVEAKSPYDLMESKVRLTQSQLHSYISESVKKVLSEIGYHEKQPKEQSEDEYREWLNRKSAAKKRYYDSQKKEKKDGATDYYDYKHGDHPAINEISSNLYDRAGDKAFKDMMQNFNDYPTKSKRERQWKNFRTQARIRGDEEKNAVCPSVDERDLPNMPAGTYVVMDGDGRDAISANFRTRYSGHAGTKEQCEEYVDRFYDKGANWEYLPEIVPLEQYLKNKR